MINDTNERKIINSVAIILGCSIAAKIFAYVWEATLAALIGASDQADAFYMMMGISAVIYPILDLGIWKVFLPIYKTKMVQNTEKGANRFANTAETFFLCLSLVFVLFLIAAAKPLVMIMAPGFSSEKKALTIYYLRLSAPAYLLMASASVIGAVLQCHGKFFGSQIRELGTHISKIIFILIFYRHWGILAAVTAMIVGGIFRLLIQLPFIDWGWKFRPDFHFRDSDILKMLQGLPSVSITAAIEYINGLVDKMIASGSGSGAISCLNYGHKLVSVFSGMVSAAIGTATYPTMIQLIAKGEKEKLKRLIGSIIGALSFLIIPISLFCITFSKELVTAAFQRGAFDTSATSLTAEVFLGYCFGMLFGGVSTIISNVFYGYGDTRTTMRISMVNVLLNIVFNLMFVRIWGVAGLAYATSLSSALCLGIRLVLLKRYIRLDYGEIMTELLKVLLTSVVAVGIAYLLFKKCFSLNLYLTLLCSVAVIAICGIFFSGLFHIKAFSIIRNTVMSKFHRR